MSQVPVPPEMEDLDDILGRLGLSSSRDPRANCSGAGQETPAFGNSIGGGQGLDRPTKVDCSGASTVEMPVVNLPPKDSKNTPAPNTKEKVCPKCQKQANWGLASWCPNCGYYPRAGEDTVVGGPLEEAQVDNHTKWMIAFGVGIISTLIVSLVGTLITSQHGWDRTYWTITQLMVGGTIFAIGHCWAFGLAMSTETNVEPLDIVVSPGKIWHPSIQRLPKTWLRLSLAVWGILLVVFALGVVGGVRYYALFEDWGFHDKPKEQNLMKEMMQNIKAAKGGEEKSLEEVMEEMIGDVQEDEGGGEAPLPKQRLHCVVLGYVEDPDIPGKIKELLLGGLVAGNLKFVGSVKKSPKPEHQTELLARLPKLHRSKPFVKLDREGVQWLRPEILCDIAFSEWNELDHMVDATFVGFTDPTNPEDTAAPATATPAKKAD